MKIVGRYYATSAMERQIAEQAAEIAWLREAHAENARVLGYLVNELQGRVEAGKLGALALCRGRSCAALAPPAADDDGA